MKNIWNKEQVLNTQIENQSQDAGHVFPQLKTDEVGLAKKRDVKFLSKQPVLFKMVGTKIKSNSLTQKA